MDDEEKPKLSDVIGGLVSSMVYARTVADMEALRIAYHYRQNEFLNGLPIPRLRLQKVSISLPVVLTGVEPGRQAKARHPTEIAEAVYKALGPSLDRVREKAANDGAMTNMKPEERTALDRLRRLLDFVLASTGAPGVDVAGAGARDPHGTPAVLAGELALAFRKIGVGDTDARTAPSDVAIREKAAETVRRHLLHWLEDIAFRYIQSRIGDPAALDHRRAADWFDSEVSRSDYVKIVIQDLCDEAEAQSVLEPTIPPDFTVSVNTANVKNEGGGADTVTRLNLVLREEGLEWVQEVGADGQGSSRLMPE